MSLPRISSARRESRCVEGAAGWIREPEAGSMLRYRYGQLRWQSALAGYPPVQHSLPPSMAVGRCALGRFSPSMASAPSRAAPGDTRSRTSCSAMVTAATYVLGRGAARRSQQSLISSPDEVSEASKSIRTWSRTMIQGSCFEVCSALSRALRTATTFMAIMRRSERA